MKRTNKIISQIRNTTSMNEKERILKANKDNELLKKVLKYTYDYRLQFNMTSDKLPEIKAPSLLFPVNIDQIFNFLDKMNNKKGATDKDRFAFINMIKSLGPEAEEIFKCIIDKDLRAGISIKTINKIFGQDFIPEFKIMLPQPQSQLNDFLSLSSDKEIYINPKYDGIRCIAEINLKDNNIILWSRNGRIYNIPILNKYILESINRKKLQNINKIILDGEIVIKNMTFKDVMKIARREKITLEAQKILDNISYHIFDIILDDVYESPLELRLEQLNNINENNVIKKVKYWKLSEKSIDEIYLELQKVLELGYEGLVLKISNSAYIRNRNISWIKIKEFDTIDCRVIKILEGSGKNKNKIGALVCKYKDIEFQVGSGLTDEFREYYWQNQNKILDKIIEVKYQEIIDKPRFPVFKKIRNDKS